MSTTAARTRINGLDPAALGGLVEMLPGPETLREIADRGLTCSPVRGSVQSNVPIRARVRTWRRVRGGRFRFGAG